MPVEPNCMLRNHLRNSENLVLGLTKVNMQFKRKIANPIVFNEDPAYRKSLPSTTVMPVEPNVMLHNHLQNSENLVLRLTQVNMQFKGKIANPTFFNKDPANRKSLVCSFMCVTGFWSISAKGFRFPGH